MAGKTLGTVVNEALKEIGEPEITAFTSSNILQQRIIEEINDSVEEIATYGDFEWLLKHANIVTTDDITSGKAKVTNGSSTVTSVDADGNDAANWSSATTGMWFRMDADKVSYPIASVDTSTTPHTITLGTSAGSGTRNYVGSTSTAGAYRIFQDTYALSISDLDEIKAITFGEAATFVDTLARQTPDNRVRLVNFDELLTLSGGDLHRNTSGRPRYAAVISNDTSENPRLVLWPFPTDDYILDVWYKERISENTTFSTTLFAGDAPPIASQAVAHRAKVVACMFDEDYDRANVWEQRYQSAVGHLLRRENREERDASFSVATYRRDYGITIPTRSGIWFDTRGAQR